MELLDAQLWSPERAEFHDARKSDRVAPPVRQGGMGVRLTMLHASMIDDIRGHLPVRHAEWWASFMTLAVGIWLSRPTQSFTTPTYAIMEQVAPESTWAAFLLELSAARLLALTLNGTFRRTRRWSPLIRSAAACISAMAWALIAFMTGTADTSTLITPIAAMIALGEFGLCLFVARRAGAADRDFQ